MKTINIATSFTLNLPSGEKRAFGVGSHEVDDAIADHWYTQAHLAEPKKATEPPPETEEQKAKRLEAEEAARKAEEEAKAGGKKK